MSKTAAVKFAETILQLFPPFRWEPDQEDRWMEIMARETSGFSDAVLDRALSIMVRRKDHRMPTPGECINACIEAKRWLDQDRQAGEIPELQRSSGDDWSADRVRLAYELCKGTQLGKEAAKDGWILSFWHFCREEQRVPKGQEIEQCKRDSAGIDEIYAACARGEGGALTKACAAWGASVIEKREKLRAEVLGR